MVKFWRFLTACFGVWAISFVMWIVPQMAYSAVDNTTSIGTWNPGRCMNGLACFTNSNGSSWGVSGSSLGSADAIIDLSDLNFNTSSTSSTTAHSHPPIYAKYTKAKSQIPLAFDFVPNQGELKWDSSHNGFSLIDEPNLVFKFEVGYNNSGFKTINDINGETIGVPSNLVTYVPAGGQGNAVSFSVKVTATVVGSISKDIDLANKTLFTVSIGKDRVLGTVKTSGTMKPIKPPKKTTCDSYTGGDKVFNLNTISIDDILAAGATSSESKNQTVTLANCPEGITLKLSLADSVSSGNTGNYLINTSGSGYSNAGVQMFYSSNTAPITMKSQFATVTTTVAGNVNLPFTAKYYNPNGNVTPGIVKSTAVLTVTYQ